MRLYTPLARSSPPSGIPKLLASIYVNFENLFAFSILAFLLMGGNQAVCSSSRYVYVDDIGHLVKLNEVPQRIVSLSPDISEILVEAGAQSKLVAVSESSNYPKELSSLPKVSGAGTINMEALLLLKPDLIVVWAKGYSKNVLEKLSVLGIPIYTVDSRHFLDIPQLIRKLGKMVGTEEEANWKAKMLEDAWVQLTRISRSKKKVRLIYEIWSDPLYVAGKEPLINEIIEQCGGENIYQKISKDYTEMNLESVFHENPMVIMDGSGFRKWKDSWRQWPELFAVEHHFLFSIEPDLLQRKGPRLIEGAKIMCSQLELVRKNWYGYDS